MNEQWNSLYRIAAPLCLTIGRIVTSAPPLPEEPVAVGNLMCTRIYLKTFLVRSFLVRSLLIKHSAQHHKCTRVNN